MDDMVFAGGSPARGIEAIIYEHGILTFSCNGDNSIQKGYITVSPESLPTVLEYMRGLKKEDFPK